MTVYRNLSGNSGVTEYEIGEGSIIVTFKGGKRYLYNSLTPGQREVDEMARRAKSGRGLSTYITQVVKTRYAAKLN